MQLNSYERSTYVRTRTALYKQSSEFQNFFDPLITDIQGLLDILEIYFLLNSLTRFLKYHKYFWAISMFVP